MEHAEKSISRFTLEAGAFLAIQVLLAAILLAGYRPMKTSYYAATLDKHARLEATPAPRLILVGGSNLAFGVDSPRLEKELGYPTINMGLNAGLSLPFMLDEARRDLHQGDVVVLSLEYDADLTPVSATMFQVIEQRPAALSSVPVGGYPGMLDDSLYFASRVIQYRLNDVVRHRTPARDPVYDRAAFNLQGDNVAHYAIPNDGTPFSVKVDIGNTKEATWANEMMPWLNTFAAECQSRGVHVYFSFPPIDQDTFNANRRLMGLRIAALRASMNIPILNAPEDLQLPRSMMFDTHYHCTRSGTDVRTTNLIETLQAAFKRDGVPLPATPTAGQIAVPDTVSSP